MDLSKPVAEMTVEELKENLDAIRRLRGESYTPGLRKTKSKVPKEKSAEEQALDRLFAKMDPEKLAELLDEME